MYTSAFIFCCILAYLLNTWILLGHRNKLGSDSNDRSYDLFYSPLSAFFSFVMILIVEGIFLVRICFVKTGLWQEFVEKNHHGLTHLDFWSFSVTPLFFIIGLLIFSTGFGLRVWAISVLGKFFTFEIGIRKGHHVVSKGPYRFLRHPSYTGYLFMTLGMGILYGSIANLIWFFGTTIFFLGIRIYFEEKMLQKSLGSEYLTYSKKTKRLIPFIY